jgi:hypothetical protein
MLESIMERAFRAPEGTPLARIRLGKRAVPKPNPG